MEAVFFDADNDGDKDLYIASGGKAYSSLSRSLNDRLYRNENGTLIFDPNALNFPKYFSTGAVTIGDVNHDGFLDILVGERFDVDNYGAPGSVFVLKNDGKGIFETTNPNELKNIGMITEILIEDLNSDRKGDLIIIGEWMPILIFSMKKQGGKTFQMTMNCTIQLECGNPQKLLI